MAIEPDTKDWTWVLDRPCPECGFEALREDQWLRTGRRSDGASFTVESFARYFVHDPIHHVHDVEQSQS